MNKNNKNNNLDKIMLSHFILSISAIAIYILIYMRIDKYVVMIFLQIYIVILINKITDAYLSNEIFVRGFYIKKNDGAIKFYYTLISIALTFVIITSLFIMIYTGYISEKLYLVELNELGGRR